MTLIFVFIQFLSIGFADSVNNATIVNDSNRNDEKTELAIRHSVERQLQEYPKSTLKDLYKSFFQDVYGPGHLINDTAAAKNYLMHELGSYQQPEGKTAEPTGYRHNYYRVNLSVIKNNIVPFDLFFDAFLQSARELKPVSIDEWKKEWQYIESVIRSMHLSLPGYEHDNNEITKQLNEGTYVGHHSRRYNDAYKPHYRIISTKAYHNIILPEITRNSKQ